MQNNKDIDLHSYYCKPAWCPYKSDCNHCKHYNANRIVKCSLNEASARNIMSDTVNHPTAKGMGKK